MYSQSFYCISVFCLMDDDLRERDIDSCIIKFLLDGYIQFILRRDPCS